MKKHTFARIEEFEKQSVISKKLGLDKRDNVILSMIQQDPNISQEDIAKKIKLSQPSVGARIRKLREKGILHTSYGVNFNIVDLFLAKVEVKSNNTPAVVKEFENCPFFINGLITSGKYNLCLLFMATDLKSLEGIVNHHLRGNKNVKEVEMNIVISTTKDLILPLNIDFENRNLSCGMDCLGYSKTDESTI